MARLHVMFLGLILLPMFGCDADKIAQLEKQNEELKAQMAKQNAAADFDLQAKCSTAARTWFNGNWASTSRDKDTILLDFTNHYNAKQNRCFILVEYHYNSKLANAGGTSWTNDRILTDVYENAKYADFTENHVTNLKPTLRVGDEVITCEVQGNKCKTQDEFDRLISPYMNN
jgi:hypothetical protein